MLVAISPAKKLDWSKRTLETTAPDFQANATSLAHTARELTVEKLKSLMHLSDALATLNADRFAAFQETPSNDVTRPALFAFAGDTYQGLDAASLDPDEIRWAQGHLRILSGLYGVLRPLDAIQAYRLEMGSKLITTRGKNLYEYWGSSLAEHLNSDAAATGSDTLVNCASQEYFGAVDTGALNIRVVSPVFMEDKSDGKPPKIISFHAKKARGAMARYIVQNRLKDATDIQNFDTGGYEYRPELSSPDKPVFIRVHSAA
mgnify:CR=1 FL=1